MTDVEGRATAELFNFPGTGRREPLAVLEMAKQSNLTDVLVLGYDQNDRLFMSTSMSELRDLGWILLKAGWKLERIAND